MSSPRALAPGLLGLLLLVGGCDEHPPTQLPVKPAPARPQGQPAIAPSAPKLPAAAAAPRRSAPQAEPMPRAPLDLSLPVDPLDAGGQGETLAEPVLLPPLFEREIPASAVQLGGRLIPDQRQETLEGAEISIEIKR